MACIIVSHKIEDPLVVLGREGRLESSYRSSQYFRPANNDFSTQGGYALLNMSAGLKFGEKFELSGFAQNILDEEYLVDAQEAVSGLLAYTQRAEPRLVGVQLVAPLK